MRRQGGANQLKVRMVCGISPQLVSTGSAKNADARVTTEYGYLPRNAVESLRYGTHTTIHLVRKRLGIVAIDRYVAVRTCRLLMEAE